MVNLISHGSINYWPLNGNLVDIVGGNDMIFGTNANFSSDRKGNELSALDLNFGYCTVPPGVYFKGDFTITLWGMLRNLTSYARIIDFGNGFSSNNVVLSFSNALSGRYSVEIYSHNKSSLVTNETLSLNVWYFFSITLQNNLMVAHLNGKYLASGTINIPRNLNRTKNYIGRSNWKGHYDSNAKISNLKFFNISLNHGEILK